MTHSWAARWFGRGLGFLFALFLLPHSRAVSAPQGVLVPSYFYPGKYWTQASATTPKAGQILILNPNSGPGKTFDKNYAATALAARNGGSTVLGYVHTTYGDRDVAAVLAEIEKFREWYQVDGIFLDEAASDVLDVPYYQTVADAIHELDNSLLIVLNPGTHPAEAYMQIADIIVTTETSFERYKLKKVPSWVYKYPANRFCHIVFAAADTSQMAQALAISRQRNAGFVYVTDDVWANPYDRLPKYWTSLISGVNLP